MEELKRIIEDSEVTIVCGVCETAVLCRLTWHAVCGDEAVYVKTSKSIQ